MRRSIRDVVRAERWAANRAAHAERAAAELATYLPQPDAWARLIETEESAAWDWYFRWLSSVLS